VLLKHIEHIETNSNLKKRFAPGLQPVSLQAVAFATCSCAARSPVLVYAFLFLLAKALSPSAIYPSRLGLTGFPQHCKLVLDDKRTYAFLTANPALNPAMESILECK
jgi:hypothetical protein